MPLFSSFQGRWYGPERRLACSVLDSLEATRSGVRAPSWPSPISRPLPTSFKSALGYRAWMECPRIRLATSVLATGDGFSLESIPAVRIEDDFGR